MAGVLGGNMGITAGALAAQVETGEQLLYASISDRFELAKLRQEKSGWSLRNKQLFFHAKALNGYEGTRPLHLEGPLSEQVEAFRQELKGQLSHLQRVLREAC